MRVLLVSPKSIIGGLESLRKGNQILQGLLYIAAAARDAGHDVTLVIANKDDIDEYIQKYDPEFLGVSCVSSTYPILRDLLIYIKE